MYIMENVFKCVSCRIGINAQLDMVSSRWLVFCCVLFHILSELFLQRWAPPFSLSTWSGRSCPLFSIWKRLGCHW